MSKTIRDLPKVELHRHLELCVRPQTLRELSPQFGIKIENDWDFNDRFVILKPMADLGAVLNKFLDTQKLLATIEILERLGFEAVEDCAKNENTKLVELRYSPTFIQMGHDLTFDQIHQAILRGVRRAEAQYPITAGLICIIQRILPVKDAEAVTQFAIDNRDTFIGLDIADNEEGFDSKPFAPFFKRAAAAGLGITVHSGEANNPKAPSWVIDAIEVLGAQRIGHGVQIHRDEAVMRRVRDQNITLELCPTSNYLTGAVPELKNHPFKKLFEYGIRTTLNTDDPVIFNTDLNREFEIAHKELGMSVDDLNRCTQFAREASFISNSPH